MKAVLFSLAGSVLTNEERAFFEKVNPVGFILFGRNIENPVQLKTLCDDLKACTKRPDTPILIDQEGGRVQRLKAPFWPQLPAAAEYGALYDKGEQQKAFTQVENHATTLAEMLKNVGINTDCWPCLDVATKNVTPALGSRLFSNNPDTVIALSQKVIDTLLQRGVMPVIKHLIGYGKATCDPHKSLPVVRENLVDLEVDFAPFRAVKKPVWGMTAHVLYTALDEQNPATVSPKIISFIRENIGFDGFLITDDISMGALSGDVVKLSKACLAAGCDAVLHCNGKLDEMQEIANNIPDLTDAALERLSKAKELL